MSHEIELVSDGAGLAVLGSPTDVERFLIDQGLDDAPSQALDLHRLSSLANTGGAALAVGSDLAANSGRWVKLTAESAKAVKQYGLMATKTPGVSHAMIGKPGEVKQWLQIASGPTALLGGPMALAALSTMMQQQAMQRQMDEIVDYLATIDEKIDDILRAQKDAVIADMIGVDLVIDDALTVRDEVGRISEITWSKVQATSLTIARTQAYAIRQLEALAEKLEKKADVGAIAKATKEAAPKVREWLAVLARCVQLQDGVFVLELDRVLDASPDDLDSHRLGLTAARQKRVELISRSTSRLLSQMEKTVQTANSKVLLNPFDSPAAVRSSNEVATGIVLFCERLGIELDHQSGAAKRWGRAAGEVVEKVRTTSADGAAGAKKIGAQTLDRATEAFRSVDIDGDGVADRPRAAVAAEEAGAAMKTAASGMAGAVGTLFQRKRPGPKSPAPASESQDS